MIYQSVLEKQTDWSIRIAKDVTSCHRRNVTDVTSCHRRNITGTSGLYDYPFYYASTISNELYYY